jgi:hypothetical protein
MMSILVGLCHAALFTCARRLLKNVNPFEEEQGALSSDYLLPVHALAGFGRGIAPIPGGWRSGLEVSTKE